MLFRILPLVDDLEITLIGWLRSKCFKKRILIEPKTSWMINTGHENLAKLNMV